MTDRPDGADGAAGGTDVKAGFAEEALPHLDAVYRFALRLSGSPDQAADLVQDTFLRCTESGERFEGRSTFRAFLFGVARRVLYDWLRAHYRDRAQLDFAEVSVAQLAADEGTTPSQFVVRHEEHRVLLQALRTIPSITRSRSSCRTGKDCRVRRSPPCLACRRTRPGRVCVAPGSPSPIGSES